MLTAARLAVLGLIGALVVGGAGRPAVASAQAPSPESAPQTASRPGLGCRVDPTVELLSVLMLLGRQQTTAVAPDHEYARDVLDRFAAYAGHPAVRRAGRIARLGYEDFAAQVGSRHGPPPALAERPPIYNVGDGASSVSADTIRALVADARDFARQTGFVAFFAAHAGLYRTLCDRVLADSMVAETPGQVERFFGTAAASYELVLMPLIPRLGVAPPGNRAGPRATLTAYVGPSGARDGQPTFRTGWAIARVVLHEFAHQHVNRVVYEAAPALARSRRLLTPMRERLWRADHVGTWTGAITETVVRATVAEMRGDAAGDPAEREELREHRAYGFVFVDSVAATLHAVRQTPASAGAWLPSAMPRVVAMLDRVADSPQQLALSDPPFEAGMAHALLTAMPDSILLILPTGERDAALQDSLRVHVERMRDRFVPRARIVTDREALGRDLRGWTLWAVGTIEGNRWLKAHASALPVVVDSTQVVADGAYTGEGLVFVGAQASPVDPRRALLLTVGQRVDEVTRGWWVVTADYAVMDGTRVVTRGKYVMEGGRRRFVRDL